MKNLILFIVSIFFFITSTRAQVTVIDLVPHSDKLAIVANSGCAQYVGFGPNPKSLNGYNIRARGDNYLAPSVYPLPGINMLCQRYIKDKLEDNSSISIEFPFKANKTYTIHMNAFLGLFRDVDESQTAPRTYPVIWIKLEDDPTLNYYSLSPCINLFPIDRIVNRYSKLLARSRPLAYPNETDWDVTFSVKENKNAIVIILDPSPADPVLHFSSNLGIRNITITEAPFVEESYSNNFYTNTDPATLGANTRNNPAYYIEYSQPIIPRDPTRGGGSISISPIITPDQWVLNSDGITYSVKVGPYISTLVYSDVLWVAIPGASIIGPRGNPTREILVLPVTFENINYNYKITDGMLEVFCLLSKPTTNIELTASYR